MVNITVIRAGWVIDGAGRELLPDQAVVVGNGRIQSITPWQANKYEGRLIDLRQATLLPGFIDTHLHLAADPGNPKSFFDTNQNTTEIILRTVGNAQACFRAGVTTVGDCGAENHIIFPVRDAINAGRLIGPRILASGAAIVPAGGHGAERIGKIASGVDGVKTAVAEQAQAGADFIKVMATAGGGEEPGASHYNLAELSAIREEAARHGLVVAAHAHGTQGIRDCTRAGIQRIEHCTFYNGEDGFIFDEETAQAIAANGIIVSPTNVIDYRRIEQGGQGAPRAELNEIWRKLLTFGIPFATSSDAGVPDIFYDDYALIPELMVAELGMSPMAAIVASTVMAAKALRLDAEIGTLETEKQADIVAVRGNPLDDISVLRQVQMVMRGGAIVQTTAVATGRINRVEM
ncbi:MAG: amidohydrolase family protein [Chloroflexi bacterium]|nr:amidohydrolase family protein [Chloroflexota bacterium]